MSFCQRLHNLIIYFEHMYFRQGLRSFAGMCNRQEDMHRNNARALVHHLATRCSYFCGISKQKALRVIFWWIFKTRIKLNNNVVVQYVYLIFMISRCGTVRLSDIHDIQMWYYNLSDIHDIQVWYCTFIWYSWYPGVVIYVYLIFMISRCSAIRLSDIHDIQVWYYTFSWYSWYPSVVLYVYLLFMISRCGAIRLSDIHDIQVW